MPYLGNEPGAITDAFTQSFTGDASTVAFTLSQASTTNSVFVRVHGVMQRNGTDFDVDGVTLTFTTAPPAGTNNIVVQFFTVGSVQEIAADAVATAKIADSAVSTAKIADNAITLAKLAGGTDGNIISFDASGDPVAIATGSDGQVLTSAGAGSPPAFEAVSAGFTQTAEVATTSGVSVAITGIASGVKLIIVMLNNVGNGGGDFKLQIGDAGGLETSSYDTKGLDIQGSTGTHTNATDGWLIEEQVGGGCSFTGQIFLTLQDASNNHWVGTGNFQNGISYGFTGGDKALSAELTQLALLSASTFDAGTINVLYL